MGADHGRLDQIGIAHADRAVLPRRFHHSPMAMVAKPARRFVLGVMGARDDRLAIDHGQARKHVQGPAAIFVIVAALILLLLALGVWRFT